MEQCNFENIKSIIYHEVEGSASIHWKFNDIIVSNSLSYYNFNNINIAPFSFELNSNSEGCTLIQNESNYDVTINSMEFNTNMFDLSSINFVCIAAQISDLKILNSTATVSAGIIFAQSIILIENELFAIITVI